MKYPATKAVWSAASCFVGATRSTVETARVSATSKIVHFVAAVHSALSELRDAGQDPAHGGTAARKRGARIAERLKANMAWDRDLSQYDPETFRREVLPAIQDVTLSELARRTGLTVQYCGLVRRGLRVPHPCQWDRFTATS